MHYLPLLNIDADLCCRLVREANVPASYILTHNPTTITTPVYGVLGSPGTAWKVVNLSSVGDYGIHLLSGGAVVNGGTAARTASILGKAGTTGTAAGIRIDNAGGTVANFGTIGGGRDGVELFHGGAVTNGAAGDTSALIFGRYDGRDKYGSHGGGGVVIDGAAGRVTNFGTINASLKETVSLEQGGIVTNGAAGASGGLISGGVGGVEIRNATGTVTNFGKISTASGTGVELLKGGSVTNGQANFTSGSISGDTGVYAYNGTGTVTNFGAISGRGVYGIFLRGGGSVTNFGTISGHGNQGILIWDGGAVTNGAAGTTTASISGGAVGVEIDRGAGTVRNFGRIAGSSSIGARLFAGGAVTNGAAGAHTASISGGKTGVHVNVAAGDGDEFRHDFGPQRRRRVSRKGRRRYERGGRLDRGRPEGRLHPARGRDGNEFRQDRELP